jgi:hypothetical protein
LTTAARATGIAVAAALGGALCHAATASPGPGATASPPAAASVPAIWAKHGITFGYQGLTTQYSCEGLKDKMEALLSYFGARDGSIRVRAYGCAGGPYRASPAVNLDMEFETLAPAPADGAAAATIRGRRVERDLFPASQISRDAPTFIQRGDCELVQKFVAKVLPSFTHDIRKDLTRCIPHELDGTVPNLRVEVLVPDAEQNRKR